MGPRLICKVFVACRDLWDNRNKYLSSDSMREELDFKFEIKELDEDGKFSGFAAVYGNEDRQGDVIEKGAFKRTLEHNDTVPVLWHHDPAQPIGVGRVRDSEKGLTIEGELNLDVQKGREAHSLMKQAATKGLSIGYDAIKTKPDGAVRRLKEIRLWEVSVVTFPANPKAQVQRVKSVIDYQDLPLAEMDREFDAEKAVERIKDHLDVEDELTDEFKNAFLWVDPDNADDPDAYELPIADVVDGKLKAVPRAIRRAASNLTSSGVPSGDVDDVKRNIDRYYEKMGMDSPFDAESVIGGDPKFERLLRRVVSVGRLKAVDAKAADVGVLSKADRALIDAAIDALEVLREDVDSDSSGKAEHQTTWTLEEANDFLDRHALRKVDAEVQENWFHFELASENDFDNLFEDESPMRLEPEDGVKFVIGEKEVDDRTVRSLQAIKFYHGGAAEEASADAGEEEKDEDPLGLADFKEWLEENAEPSGDKGETPEGDDIGGDSDDIHSLLEDFRNFARDEN